MTNTNTHSRLPPKERKLISVPNPVSQETIGALEYLLQEAKRGELIGLVYGGMLKGRSCIVDTTGEAFRNPMFALGMVGMLSADIADRTREASE